MHTQSPVTAKNIIDPDVWAGSCVVLIWQCHKLPITDVASLIDDLKSDFVLHKTDIPHLIANQRVFDLCAKQFLVALAADSPWFGRSIVCFRFRGEPAAASSVSMVRDVPTFPTGGELLKRLFYKVWVYCVASKYDNVGFPTDRLSRE